MYRRYIVRPDVLLFLSSWLGGYFLAPPFPPRYNKTREANIAIAYSGRPVRGHRERNNIMNRGLSAPPFARVIDCSIENIEGSTRFLRRSSLCSMYFIAAEDFIAKHIFSSCISLYNFLRRFRGLIHSYESFIYQLHKFNKTHIVNTSFAHRAC